MDVLQTELVRAIFLAVLFSGILLLPSFMVGLLVGVLQAITSVQDQMLSFAPKVILASLVLYFSASWMLQQMQSYTVELYEQAAKQTGQ